MIPLATSFVLIISMISGWPSSSRSVTTGPTYSTEEQCAAAASVLKAGKLFAGTCIPAPVISAPQVEPDPVAAPAPAPVADETAPIKAAPKHTKKGKAAAKAAPAPVTKAPAKPFLHWPWG